MEPTIFKPRLKFKQPLKFFKFGHGLAMSKLVGNTLILSMESGSMCKHQGSSEQSGSYTTLSSFLWLKRILCKITCQNTLLGKKEKKIIVQIRRGFSLSSPSQFILCRLRGKDSCRQGFILKHCLRWTSRIHLSKISTPFLTFLIPFVIIKAKFWQWITSEFSNPA